MKLTGSSGIVELKGARHDYSRSDAEVAMTPDKVGEFTFVCDVFCGSGHENMEGTIRVVA